MNMQVLSRAVKVNGPLVGRHPQPVGYYLSLGAGTFRTMLDIGMLVLGTGWMMLAVMTFLETFEITDTRLEMSTAAGLGALLVALVCAGCAFGIASEGHYGAADSIRPAPDGEVGIGRAVGAVFFSLIVLAAATWLAPLVETRPVPYRMAHEILSSTAQAGLLVMPILGVPLALLVRRSKAPRLERLVLFGVWALATVAIARFPYV